MALQFGATFFNFNLSNPLQQEGFFSGEQNGEAWGFRADFLLHPRSTAGVSLARTAQDQVWSLNNETQVNDKTTLYSRYNLWQDGRRDSDVRLFRTLGAGSVSAGWRHGVADRGIRTTDNNYSRTSDLYTLSGTWQFQNKLSLTASSQYTRNGYRNGLSSDLSVPTFSGILADCRAFFKRTLVKLI